MKMMLTVAAAAAMGLSGIAYAQPGPATPLPARFEAAPCPVETAPGEKIDCGVLVVPENRAKAGSREIRLAVVIQRARTATPARDALMFLPGGPGVSAMNNARSGKGNPFLEQRDQVLMEPRGGRHAQPALECPEMAKAREVSAPSVASMVAAARTCRARLVASGVDLDGYTSAETADDIEALRVALGYDKLNLYGLSYGTRLALTVLRRHPDSVRSMVLDSVLPPQVNSDEAAAGNVRRALNLVFDGCAADPVCSRAYPDLRDQFAALVASADRRPLAIPAAEGAAAIQARGADVVDALLSALDDPALTPRLPRIIAEASAGRTAELAPLVARARQPSGFAWGLRLSVWCAEEAPFEDKARVDAQVAPAQGLGGLDTRAAPPEVCAAWKAAPAPAVENTPVKSEVPVLIFAGELDPITPPAWGQGLLADLPNARFVLMPRRAHAASFNGCAARMTVPFINDPSRPVDTLCAQADRGVDWSLAARP